MSQNASKTGLSTFNPELEAAAAVGVGVRVGVGGGAGGVGCRGIESSVK